MQPKQNTLQIVYSAQLAELPLPVLRRRAFDLKRAGQTIGQIARKIGRSYNDTDDLIEAGRSEWMAAELRRAYAAGRRSLLTPPPATERRAA